jgi:hypothetical protein
MDLHRFQPRPALPGRFSEAFGVIRLAFQKRPPMPQGPGEVGCAAACHRELRYGEEAGGVS